MLQTFEDKHRLVRWATDSPEYQSTSEDNDVCSYRKALDKLEGLVVQRLFELTKLNISGTGYKMRTHISKSLKTRCRAIQTVLRQFNAASRKIGHEELDWDDVSKYSSIAEFELWQECRVDIRSQPWADAVNCQAANHTLRIEHAEEEHQWLNVEVSRMAAWIRDEDNDIVDAVRCLESEGNCLLAAELRVFGTRRRRVNDIHRIRIQQIYALPYFKGDWRVGIMLEWQGEDAMELGDPPIELDADVHTREDEEDGLDAAEDDDIAEQLYALSSFMEDLALVTEPGEMAF